MLRLIAATLACTHVFTTDVEGHALRVPCGWHARVQEGDTTAVTAAGVNVQIADLGIVRWKVPPRPRRLHLGAPQPFEGIRVGYNLVFRLRDHAFQVIAEVASARRGKVARMLDTLHLTNRAFEVANFHTVSVFGRSVQKRPLRVWRIGNPRSKRRILVVGCIHGDECAGTAVTSQLVNLTYPIAADLWVVQDSNPDGFARGTRQNADGVDLNRNFPSHWIRIGRRGTPQYSGPRPLSEPESRALRALILRVRPQISIWFHQPQDVVRAWGASVPVARRYARLAGLPFKRLGWPNGTASNWQNHRFPGTASFVVENPAGRLTPAAARREANSVLALAQ